MTWLSTLALIFRFSPLTVRGTNLMARLPPKSFALVVVVVVAVGNVALLELTALLALVVEAQVLVMGIFVPRI